MKPIYLASTLLLCMSTATYAADDQRIIHLSRAAVAHLTPGQSVNEKNIDLSKLKQGQDSWHITCHYKITGKSDKTDVSFAVPGTQPVNLDQDYNPYDNKGIAKRAGELHFTLDQADLAYSQAFMIRNYDAVNNITVSRCKAIWLDG